MKMKEIGPRAVADLGFPRGGGANSPGGHQHTILPKFLKNCMKLKEFGPPGGGGVRPKFYYVDPPLERGACVPRVPSDPPLLSDYAGEG